MKTFIILILLYLLFAYAISTVGIVGINTLTAGLQQQAETLNNL